MQRTLETLQFPSDLLIRGKRKRHRNALLACYWIYAMHPVTSSLINIAWTTTEKWLQITLNLIWKCPLGTATILPITDLSAKSAGYLGIWVARGMEIAISNHSCNSSQPMELKEVISALALTPGSAQVSTVLSPLSTCGAKRKRYMFPSIWDFVCIIYHCCPNTALSDTKL